MRIRSTLIAAAVVCCFGASAFAGNPMYDSWASHKAGTSVTMTSATEASGMKSDSEMTYTLKEVTPAKVVVEMKSVMTVMGNKMESPAQTMEILSDAAVAAPTQPPSAPNTPAPDTKTSEEKVTVAGKEYSATCTTTKVDANGMKSTSTIWTSAEVPGMTLKMENSSDGQMKSTTKMEVTKVEIK